MYLISLETWLDPAIARFLLLQKLVGPLCQQMAIATLTHPYILGEFKGIGDIVVRIPGEHM